MRWISIFIFCCLLFSMAPAASVQAATSVTFSSQADFESAISQTGVSTTATPGALALSTLSTAASPALETRNIAVLQYDDATLDPEIDFYLSAYFPNFSYEGDEAADDVLQFADVDELSDLAGYELLVVLATTTTQARAIPSAIVDAFADAGGIVVEDIMGYSVRRQADTYGEGISFDYTIAAIRDMASDGTYLWTLDDTSPERILKIDPYDGSTVATYCAPDATPRSIEYVNNMIYISDSYVDALYELDPASLTVYDGVCAAPYEGSHWHFSDLSPASTSPWGLASDGTNFYLVDSISDRLYEFTISGANLVQSNSWLLTGLTPRPATLPRGLAYHDGHIWYADPSTGLIYKLNPADPSVTVTAYDVWDNWGTDEDPTGITFIGDDLWITDDDPTVKKLYNHSSFYLDKDNFEYFNKGNTSFETPSVKPKGLAYDGTYFWLADDFTNTIYKLNATTGAVISTCIAPYSRPTGVAYNAGTLWISDWASDMIYLMDAATCAISSSYASPGTSPHGLVHDGTNLWHADSASSLIYKLNPTTGATVSSFASPAITERGLAWDGTYLWLADETGDLYYQIDPTDGSTVNTRTVIELSAEGIAFKDGLLWSVDDVQNRIYNVDSAQLAIGQFKTPATEPAGFVHDGTNLWSLDTDTNMLYQLNATTGAIVTSYETPGDDPKDITWDGSYLWITTDADDKICKIDPADGSIEARYNAPDTNPHGIVYFEGYLYVTDPVANEIWKIDPADGSVEETYDAPGSATGPLASDGTHVWNYDTDERLIYKLVFDSDDEEGIVEGVQDVYTTSITGIDFIDGELWIADAYFDMFFDSDSISVAPEVAIAIANEFTSPFGVGDSVYWTTRNVGEAFYYHRRLGGVTETANRHILATSSRGGAAVVHESRSNDGRIIVIDTNLLGINFEISRQTVPAVTLFLNALGIQIHENGVHEQTRPTYTSLSADLSQLMTDCADSFTRSTIGTASNAEPIHAYQYGTVGKPIVIYNSGMHGNEEHAYVPQVRFMQQLCTDYLAGTDRAINVQKNFDIRFIPLMNPYGIMNFTRYNANGVDLNRNFDYQWASFGSSTKGSAVFSEPETQAIRDYILEYQDDILFVNDAHSAMAISPGMTWGFDLGITPPDFIEDVYDIYTAQNQYRWFEEKAGVGRWLTYDRYTTHDGTVPYFGNWLSSLGLVSSTNEVMGKKDVSTQRMIHTNAWYISHFDATFDALSYRFGRSVYRIDTGNPTTTFSSAVSANTTEPDNTDVTFRYASNSTTNEPTTWYTTYSDVPAGRYLFVETTLERDSFSTASPSVEDFSVSYSIASTSGHSTVNNNYTQAKVLSNLEAEQLHMKNSVFATGKPILFSWDTSGIISYVSFSYSTDGGNTYTSIAENRINTDAYVWIPVQAFEGDVLFKVEGTDLSQIITSATISLVFAQESREEELVMPGSYFKGRGFSTVYYLDDSYIRHPFIDEQTYFTYAKDFSQVMEVEDTWLALYSLGAPMLPKPGSILIKIQSDPKVYLIEANSENLFKPFLRWIPNEATALALYGLEWNKQIIDLQPTLWPRFILSAPIASQ